MVPSSGAGILNLLLFSLIIPYAFSGSALGMSFKFHLSIDSKTMLLLSCLFASANDNEKKHSLTLLERAKIV